MDLEKRKLLKKVHMLDPTIENLNDILIQLDEDLNYQYPEEEESLDNNNQYQ